MDKSNSRKTFAVLMAASIAATLLTTYGAVWMTRVEASHFVDVTDNSPLVRRPYGYVPLFTGLAHGYPDNTVLFDVVTRLDPAEGDPAPLVNPNGATGLSSANVMTAVGNAAQDWMNSAAAGNTEIVDFTSPTQDNTAEASLLDDEWCGFSLPEGPNNRWEIDICDLNHPLGIQTRGVVVVSPSMDEAAANGFIDQFIEADMGLHTHSLDQNLNDIPWTSLAEMQGVARHEFGHWYGLGDLYRMWDDINHANSTCATDEAAQGPPVMCTSVSPVHTGDVNGLFYMYPEQNTFDFPDTFVNNNIDAAVTQIAGSANNNADMITLISDRDAGTNNNHLKIRPLVDIDPNTYVRTLGVTETLFTVNSGTLRDIGIAIGNVDNAADNVDMVVGYVTTQGLLKFRTYFDISLASNNLGWSGSPSAEQTVSPATTNHYGLDMVMLNMDGDARQEMMLFSTEIVGGTRYLHYWLVEFNNDGSIAGTTAFTSNTVIVDDPEIGAGVVDATNRKVAIMANAEPISAPDEYVGYKVLAFNSGGGLNVHSDRRVGPLESSNEASATLDGFGGDAFASNGLGSANADIYFVFVDGDVEEFYIERDSLWASHGTSDNTNS